MDLTKKTREEKLAKRRRKLEQRIKHFETNKTIQDSNRRFPGAFTKPGSIKK